MSDYNLQKSLESFSSVLNNIITKPVCKNLPGQRWNCHASRFSLKYVAEILEIGIPSTNTALSQLEGRYICTADNLVVGIHMATDPMGAGVPDLNFEEVLWRSIDLLEALLAGIWHSLHRSSCYWRKANVASGVFSIWVKIR